MNIHKDFRGQGIAQMLLDSLLNGKNNSCIYLSTNSFLAVAAIKFYKRNKFTEVSKDELPKDFPFFYEDNLFMKKELS